MGSRSIKMRDLSKDGISTNIVGDYSWTVSNNALAREQVPIIEIQEFQPNVSSIRQAIEYWAGQAGNLSTGATGDPYEGLYSVQEGEPGNTYIFPFYSVYHHQIRNAWGQNIGVMDDAINHIQEVVTQVGRARYVSAGIENAKSWEGTTPAEYSFTFQLLNTVDPANDIQKNKTLIDALINNNLKDKIDFLVTRPPAICRVSIPGIRGTNVAVMSQILIENLGQINRIDSESIPDAYQITISMQELLNESRQIWANSLTDKVFSRTVRNTGGINEDIDDAKKFAKKFAEI